MPGGCRSVGCTALNEQSSRSHMVFTLRIDGVNTSTDVKVRALCHTHTHMHRCTLTCVVCAGPSRVRAAERH